MKSEKKINGKHYNQSNLKEVGLKPIHGTWTPIAIPVKKLATTFQIPSRAWKNRKKNQEILCVHVRS